MWTTTPPPHTHTRARARGQKDRHDDFAHAPNKKKAKTHASILTYNVMRRDGATIVVVENQYVLHIVSVCM